MTDYSKPDKDESITKPEQQTQIQSDWKADDWLCSRCYNKITSDQYRFFYENKNEFSFTNPAGFQFQIITFSIAEGCMDAGGPTNEFTWFPGHAWLYAMCAKCGLHLGWKYIGQESFYGLIRNRLVKALTLFN